MTCRQDAIDGLEKRVKSRFSHRILDFYPPQTVEVYRDIVKATLMLDDCDTSMSKKQLCQFNERMNEVLLDPRWLKVTQRLFDLERNVRQCFKVLMRPVMEMKSDCPQIHLDAVLEELVRQGADSKSELIKDLSVLELCLLIAMKRMVDLDTDRFNFCMVFDVYNDFATLHAIGYKKNVALKAFEHLLSLELIVADDSVSKCPKEFRMVRMMLEPQQISDAVIRSNAPYSIKRWGTE
jgi:origin recognition complex subunit 4